MELVSPAPDREIVSISPPSENLHFSQETCGCCEVWQVHWEPLWSSARAALVVQATTCSWGTKTQLLPLSLSAGIGVSRPYRWQLLSFFTQTGFVSKPDISARMRMKIKENPKLFLLASVSWNTFSLTCAWSKQNRNAGEYPLSQKTHGNMVKNKLQTQSQLV